MPRIDQRDAATLEILHVMGSKCGTARICNTSDHRVRHLHGATLRAPLCHKHRVRVSRSAVIRHFAPTDGCGEQPGAPLRAQPGHHRRRGLRALQLRQHIDIQHDHLSMSASSKLGGSRCSSHGGSSSSTPPKGSTRARMAAYDAAPKSSSTPPAKAARRMLRASSSIDYPCCAARSRSKVFRSSSGLRMVMLAMDRSSGSDGNACVVIIRHEQGHIACQSLQALRPNGAKTSRQWTNRTRGEI